MLSREHGSPISYGTSVFLLYGGSLVSDGNGELRRKDGVFRTVISEWTYVIGSALGRFDRWNSGGKSKSGVVRLREVLDFTRDLAVDLEDDNMLPFLTKAQWEYLRLELTRPIGEKVSSYGEIDAVGGTLQRLFCASESWGEESVSAWRHISGALEGLGFDVEVVCEVTGVDFSRLIKCVEGEGVFYRDDLLELQKYLKFGEERLLYGVLNGDTDVEKG